MYEATLRTRKSRTRGKTTGTDLQVSDLRDWTTRLSRNPCGWGQTWKGTKRPGRKVFTMG